MRVLISGATGLIGSALVVRLGQAGHTALRLVRADPAPGGTDVRWDPAAGALDPAPIEGLDAVVHLAGENIASGAWTDAKKARIRASRVDATALLARTLAGLSRPPAVLACASAVGYYGDRGDEVLTEESSAGTGFLASVCRDWEQATALAERGRHPRAAPALRRGARLLRGGLVQDARPVPDRHGRAHRGWAPVRELDRARRRGRRDPARAVDAGALGSGERRRARAPSPNPNSPRPSVACSDGRRCSACRPSASG